MSKEPSVTEMSSEDFIEHVFYNVLGGFYADSEEDARLGILDMIEDMIEDMKPDSTPLPSDVEEAHAIVEKLKVHLKNKKIQDIEFGVGFMLSKTFTRIRTEATRKEQDRIINICEGKYQLCNAKTVAEAIRKGE